MKIPLALLGSAFLLSCSTPEERRRTELMDEIESRVKLPDGAMPLSRYARFYTQDRSDRIIGLYVVPAPPLPPDAGCSELQEDFTLKPRDCSSLPTDPLEKVRANERIWLERKEELPGIADGGCGIVNVVYQPSTKTVEDTYCNGVA